MPGHTDSKHRARGWHLGCRRVRCYRGYLRYHDGTLLASMTTEQFHVGKVAGHGDLVNCLFGNTESRERGSRCNGQWSDSA